MARRIAGLVTTTQPTTSCRCLFQGSFYSQPKQYIDTRESPQNYHTVVLFDDPPKMGNLMTPVFVDFRFTPPPRLNIRILRSLGLQIPTYRGLHGHSGWEVSSNMFQCTPQKFNIYQKWPYLKGDTFSKAHHFWYPAVSFSRV